MAVKKKAECLKHKLNTIFVWYLFFFAAGRFLCWLLFLDIAAGIIFLVE